MADSADTLPGEIWKAGVGYEGLYEVSSRGRVRSLDRTTTFERRGEWFTRTRKGKIRPPQRSGSYYMVILSPHFETGLPRRGRTIHTLVCEAFHGPRPEGAQCSHLDGNGLNNQADNLRWESVRRNNARKFNHGTVLSGENHPSAKLNEDGVRAIHVLRKSGMPRKVIANALRVTEACVADVLYGRSWQEVH